MCFRTSSRGPKLTPEEEYQTLITNLVVTHSFLYQMAYSSTEEGEAERPLVVMPRELILTQEKMDFLDQYYAKKSGANGILRGRGSFRKPIWRSIHRHVILLG